jgi:exopolyphosphatase/guanosine-5'-triphosphate,3'-diphosphate pyrophosphatase
VPTEEITVRKVAAIDLGTNSLRALIADVSSDGSFRIVSDEKFPCRIGEGMALTGRLSEEAMSRTVEGLRRSLTIARGHGVHHIAAVATGAVREAVNGSVFLDRVREQLGIQLELISGDEEARLAFLSLRRHFDLSQQPTIVTDIGGGTLEVLVAARDQLVEDIFSLPLGAVRLTELFLPDPVITEKQYRRLRRHVKSQLEDTLAEYSGQGHRLYGSGGALTSLAKVVNLRRGRAADDVMGREIPRSDLRHLREILRSLPLDERRKVVGLSYNRAEIIVAAAVVLEETMRVLGAESITVNAQGIREGLLLRTMEDLFAAMGESGQSPRQSRSVSVRAFARSCGFDEPHAEHVRKLALSLFDDLPAQEDIDGDEARILLEAAALLHDVGQLVRYEGHHKHSHHLITHAELAGFTPRRLQLVGLIARFHTGKPPKKDHSSLVDLRKPDRKLVRYLASILRLADGLDRCHCQRVRKVHIDQERDGGLTLTLEADSNPELELWAAQRKVDLLEKLLRTRVEIRAAAVPAEAAQ